jgi:hypothetical protein
MLDSGEARFEEMSVRILGDLTWTVYVKEYIDPVEKPGTTNSKPVGRAVNKIKLNAYSFSRYVHGGEHTEFILRVDLNGVSIGPYIMKITYSVDSDGGKTPVHGNPPLQTTRELLDIPINIVKDVCSKFCCFFF